MTHWTKLKKMVEDAGGVWTNREEAEEFLASVGGGAVVDAPAVPVVTVSLDKSKPYGTVHGNDDRFRGAVYTQNGSYFDEQGKKVG